MPAPVAITSRMRQLGSGLGLAICHSIIGRHDGLITVQSTPGRGTVFEVYLPVSASDAVAAAGRVEERPAAQGARVLVMDDEQMIQQVAGTALGKLGHEVLVAADGEEALRLYREAAEQGRPVDLVIMDLTIPGGLGGREAIAGLLALDPEARVIVSSGYSHDPIMADYTAYGFRAALAKPFDFLELSRVVNRLLGPDTDN